MVEQRQDRRRRHAERPGHRGGNPRELGLRYLGRVGVDQVGLHGHREHRAVAAGDGAAQRRGSGSAGGAASAAAREPGTATSAGPAVAPAGPRSRPAPSRCKPARCSGAGPGLPGAGWGGPGRPGTGGAGPGPGRGRLVTGQAGRDGRDRRPRAGQRRLAFVTAPPAAVTAPSAALAGPPFGAGPPVGAGPEPAGARAPARARNGGPGPAPAGPGGRDGPRVSRGVPGRYHVHPGRGGGHGVAAAGPQVKEVEDRLHPQTEPQCPLLDRARRLLGRHLLLQFLRPAPTPSALLLLQGADPERSPRPASC